MPLTTLANVAFKAIADPDKVIWIRPVDVIYKVACNGTLHRGDVLSGDWDLERRPLERSAKHSAIAQHFTQGVDWEDTDLFKSVYALRLARGEKPHGARNLADMKHAYERYDRLFESMRRNGFLLKIDPDGAPVKLPHVHLGRDGEIFLGRDGNHRFAMAKILAIETVPCRVHARHALWQQVRDLALLTGPEPCRTKSRLWPHPDLADLLTLEDISKG